MEIDLRLERVYPHGIDDVWRAVATSQGLAAWLMDNDFTPEVGRVFTFSFCNPDGDPDDVQTVFAEVLVLEPRRRIAWKWRNEEEKSDTRVEITLQAVAGGTRVVLTHRGPVSDETGETLTGGWPTKLDALGKMLGAPAR